MAVECQNSFSRLKDDKEELRIASVFVVAPAKAGAQRLQHGEAKDQLRCCEAPPAYTGMTDQGVIFRVQ
jgi:hypothetical protein